MAQRSAAEASSHIDFELVVLRTRTRPAPLPWVGLGCTRNNIGIGSQVVRLDNLCLSETDGENRELMFLLNALRSSI